MDACLYVEIGVHGIFSGQEYIELGRRSMGGSLGDVLLGEVRVGWGVVRRFSNGI